MIGAILGKHLLPVAPSLAVYRPYNSQETVQQSVQTRKRCCLSGGIVYNRPMSQLHLYVLGPPRLERDGEPVKISLRKALALLTYLAVSRQIHSRDALAALFWPDDSQSDARGNLRRALSRLTQAMGSGGLEIDRETAGLHPLADLWVDVDQFRRQLTASRAHDHAASDVCPDCLPHLAAAVELYRDDFLAGFSLPDCPAFDEWQFFQSEGLRQELAAALARLASRYGRQGDYERAIPYARRWLALDALHEPAHRQLMMLYAQSGQQAMALRQYDACARALEEELGAAPSAETTALFVLIKTKRLASKIAEAARKPPTPHNLPLQPTPFVGRERELADVAQRLANPACRLLTLIGPGGIGKTRLALEAAARFLSDERFPGGIFFVPLAAVDAGDLLVSAIADPLVIVFQSGADSKTQLLDYLGGQGRAMLLVLDNFEQLLDGAVLLAEILQRAPAVKLLVTSRERLNLVTEWLFDLQGLPFPMQFQPGDDLEGYAAVQLFAQTAARSRASFALTDADRSPVAQICRQLEGMPLGLELAAAWVRTLSCQEIADELAGDLALLTTSLRDVPDRHRSLTAVFDHSWRRLPPEEQRVFRWLSVFRGGFSITAAQEVVGTSLATVLALADKSFVRADADGRFELHEMLRHYGNARLFESGETKRARDQHLACFINLAEAVEPRLQGGEQSIWLKRLAADSGNLHAALAWSLEDGDAKAGLRLAAALGQYWYMRSRDYDEGATWLKRLLARVAAGDQPAQRAKALLWLGLLAHYQGDDSTARPAFEESLALCQALEDNVGIGESHLYLGDIASYSGADDAASSHYAAARSAYARSLAVLRERGDSWTVARILNCLGEIARIEDDYAAARAFYAESLAIRRTLADQRGMAVTLYNLGHVALRQDDVVQAAEYFGASLIRSQQLGDKRGVADSLAGMAAVMGAVRRPARAARLFGAADALYADSVARLEYPDQVEHDRNVAVVRGRLDERIFALAWAEGRAMTQEHAVGYALAMTPHPASEANNP